MADTATTVVDYNRGPEILAICGALVGLSVAIVLLRLWVKTKIIHQVGYDDHCMLAALIIVFAEMMIIIAEVRYGGGRHVEYIIPASDAVVGLHLNFITQPLCLVALCLTKVSVGLFLLRLTPSGLYRNVILGVTIFTILSATGNFLTVFFQCRPLAFTWDVTTPGGECIPAAHLKFAAFFNSSVSVLTDLLFALLPVPMLWKVQLNWKVKAAVVAILSLGIFATAAALVKISFLSSYGSHGDFLFDSSDLTIWTTVEICTAMIAASIPSLKPLFRSLLSGSSAAKYGSRTTKGYMRNDDTSRKGTGIRGDGNDFELDNRQRNMTDIKSGFRTKYSQDNLSDESILHEGDRDSGSGGIKKTTQIFMSVDDTNPKRPKDMV